MLEKDEPSIRTYALCMAFVFIIVGYKPTIESLQEGSLLFLETIPSIVSPIADSNKEFPKELFYGAILDAYANIAIYANFLKYGKDA